MARMSLELRDELAARVAAGLAPSTMLPREVARRAYAIADAMLRERVYQPANVAELYDDSGIPEASDPRWLDAPYDPRWEVEPRWSLDDAARRDERIAASDNGPGLVNARPPREEKDKRTG